MTIHRRTFLGLAAMTALAGTKALAAEPCCGPITAAGQNLGNVLDSMDVENHWLVDEHINWQTGEIDRNAEYEGPDTSTHCSAFAAAVGLRLGVYLLRPPEHGQTLLASAQTRWLSSPGGAAAGWTPVSDMQTAQSLANQGEMVVISYENPDPHRPGHIVVVRPSLKTTARFAVEGPQIIMAADTNRASYPAAHAFNAHPGAWPNAVKIFAHAVL